MAGLGLEPLCRDPSDINSIELFEITSKISLREFFLYNQSWFLGLSSKKWHYRGVISVCKRCWRCNERLREVQFGNTVIEFIFNCFEIFVNSPCFHCFGWFEMLRYLGFHGSTRDQKKYFLLVEPQHLVRTKFPGFEKGLYDGILGMRDRNWLKSKEHLSVGPWLDST